MQLLDELNYLNLPVVTTNNRITIIELHFPCSSDSNDPMKDLSHVLEFLCHVKYVQIVGSPDNFGTSNIKTQFLPFDVSFFKSVEELEVE